MNNYSKLSSRKLNSIVDDKNEFYSDRIAANSELYNRAGKSMSLLKISLVLSIIAAVVLSISSCGKNGKLCPHPYWHQCGYKIKINPDSICTVMVADNQNFCKEHSK